VTTIKVIESTIAWRSERLQGQLLHSRSIDVIRRTPRESLTVLLYLPVLAKSALSPSIRSHGNLLGPSRDYYRFGDEMV